MPYGTAVLAALFQDFIVRVDAVGDGHSLIILVQLNATVLDIITDHPAHLLHADSEVVLSAAKQEPRADSRAPRSALVAGKRIFSHVVCCGSRQPKSLSGEFPNRVFPPGARRTRRAAVPGTAVLNRNDLVIFISLADPGNDRPATGARDVYLVILHSNLLGNAMLGNSLVAEPYRPAIGYDFLEISTQVKTTHSSRRP